MSHVTRFNRRSIIERRLATSSIEIGFRAIKCNLRSRGEQTGNDEVNGGINAGEIPFLKASALVLSCFIPSSRVSRDDA